MYDGGLLGRPKNANKRSKNYKLKGEVGGSIVDIILANIEVLGIDCGIENIIKEAEEMEADIEFIQNKCEDAPGYFEE